MGLSDFRLGRERLSRASRWPFTMGHRDGSPVLRGLSPCRVPSSLPRWNRTRPVALTRPTWPSPYGRRVGFHNRRFRGLLDVHSRYGPPTRGAAPGGPVTSEAFDRSLPPDRFRLLPDGQPPFRMGFAPIGHATPFHGARPKRQRGILHPSLTLRACARTPSCCLRLIIPRNRLAAQGSSAGFWH